jgi:hypothetical protein
LSSAAFSATLGGRGEVPDEPDEYSEEISIPPVEDEEDGNRVVTSERERLETMARHWRERC